MFLYDIANTAKEYFWPTVPEEQPAPVVPPKPKTEAKVKQAALSIKDFTITNEWEIADPNNTWKNNPKIAKLATNPDFSLAEWNWSDKPLTITDKTTGKKYLNLPPEYLKKCHGKVLRKAPIYALIDTLMRIIKLITLSHFWLPEEQGLSTLKERFTAAKIDLMRIFIVPFAALMMTIAAIYGMIKPNDGRKLCTSISRLVPKVTSGIDLFPKFRTYRE
jgi:hypothetical protein